MKKFSVFCLSLIAAFLFTVPAFASLEVSDATTNYGAQKKLVISGLTLTESSGTLTVSGATPTITGGTIDGATVGATTPAAGSFSALTAGGLAGAATTWKWVANGIEAEGATADAFEATLLFADPTADFNINLPASAASVGVVYSSLTTNAVDVSNSVTLTSNGFIAEGATADGFETTVSFADPGADFTLTIPASTAAAAPLYTSLTTNAVDAANSVTGTSNGFIAEGATADAFETTVTFADPTADETITVPTTAGAAGAVQLSGATVVITAGTTPTLTVPLAVDFIATDTITTDNQDQTITFSSGGSLGQVCTIVFQTDSGGSNDEIITFHTTLTNTTGTLTLANLTANQYVVKFVSDGTIWHETSRTGAQT